MHAQSTDQNLDSEDFQEAPSMQRSKGYHPIVLGVGGALFGLILAVILIRGSMPEMSPEQIVAMEGYQGEQPPRYIFNLYSIEPGNAPGAVSGVVTRTESSGELSQALTSHRYAGNATNSAPQIEAATMNENAANEVTAGGVGAVSKSDAISALLAIETEEPGDTWPLEIVEVPASPIIVGKDAQEVAAPVVEEFDYRTLNRRGSTEVQNSGASVASGRMAVQREQGEAGTTIRVLPVFTVSTDSAYVRSEPTQSSDIKLVLARGSSVTAFDQSGAWVHVGANDGSSITGYVHQSMIAVTEIN